MKQYQTLSDFRLPKGYRGRSIIWVQAWRIVKATFFRLSPRRANNYRALLLRIFGARIGKSVIIRPSVDIEYPWKLAIANYSWIGEKVIIYNHAFIDIGENCVISQYSHLCTGDHDPQSPSFEILSKPISIGSRAWIATDVFVGPGVTIGESSVIGARSSVFRDLPAGVVAHGSPCRVSRSRNQSEPKEDSLLDR